MAWLHYKNFSFFNIDAFEESEKEFTWWNIIQSDKVINSILTEYNVLVCSVIETLDVFTGKLISTHLKNASSILVQFYCLFNTMFPNIFD